MSIPRAQSFTRAAQIDLNVQGLVGLGSRARQRPRRTFLAAAASEVEAGKCGASLQS